LQKSVIILADYKIAAFYEESYPLPWFPAVFWRQPAGSGRACG
jgi:hypothetical protein